MSDASKPTLSLQEEISRTEANLAVLKKMAQGNTTAATPPTPGPMQGSHARDLTKDQFNKKLAELTGNRHPRSY